MFRPLALLLQRTFDSQWRPDDSLNIVIDLDNVFPSAPLFSSDDAISPLLIDREPELYNNTINFLPSFLLPSPPNSPEIAPMVHSLHTHSVIRIDFQLNLFYKFIYKLSSI